MGKELFPSKSGLGLMEPVALVGQNVCIMMSASNEYRKVAWWEPIPPFQCLDIGAIAAQTQSNRIPATNLQLWDDEFGQFRWYPLDPVQVRLFLPQANGRYLLRNIQVPIDDNIVEKDPCLHLTEIFVWEDKNPWFEAMNFSDYAINTSRIMAMGFRFVTDPLPEDVIKAIKEGKEACTYIITSGSSGRPE
jgi:hypothetical protein